jgi:hypothetical protein
MTFYILLDQVTKLFVSLGLLTTLSFDSQITSYLYGGSKEDLFISVTNNMRTLTLKPKREGVNSNLLVITKNRKYYFDINYSESNPHKFIEVKSGQINHGMRKLFSINGVDVLEGQSSVLLINNNKKSVQVNGQKVAKKKYLSKGVPIFLENKRIYN